MTEQDWRSKVERYTDSQEAEEIAGWMAGLRCAVCREPAKGYDTRDGWVNGGGPAGNVFPKNLMRCSCCQDWVCYDHCEANRLGDLCCRCWELHLFLEEKPDTEPKVGFRELVLSVRNRGSMPSLEALWEIWVNGQTARFCSKCGIPAPPGQQVCPMCESAEHLRPIEP